VARVDDPSGKVRGIVECCKKCRKTPRSAIVTFLSIFAILCGVAFVFYALIMDRHGIDPESHWFGSMSLTVAEWTGKNRENIRDFAELLDLLLYAAAGLGGALGFSRWRGRKRKKTGNDQ
jgi:hypothetical protein